MKQSALLKRILTNKRSEVVHSKKVLPLPQLKEQLAKTPPVRNFREAITKRRAYDLHLIAELKKASPLKGVLRQKFNVAAIAKEFAEAGARALSVLTDAKYFQGSLENIKIVKEACDLPVMRKDFITDEYQIYESRLAGADAVLLIARLLDQKKLKRFVTITKHLGMSPVVETHSAAEVKRALNTETEIVGINTRDLGNFKVDFEIVKELRDRVPPDKITICESGIDSSDKVNMLRDLKFSAVLIGEAIMRTRNSRHSLVHEFFYS